MQCDFARDVVSFRLFRGPGLKPRFSKKRRAFALRANVETRSTGVELAAFASIARSSCVPIP